MYRWFGLGNEGGVFCVFSFGTFLKSLKVYFVEIIFTSEALILKFKFLKIDSTFDPSKSKSVISMKLPLQTINYQDNPSI